MLGLMGLAQGQGCEGRAAQERQGSNLGAPFCDG